MTIETKSPTSNTGNWHDPDNAHTDDLAYAYCGNGEGGRTQDYEGYGFAAEGTLNEVRVDVKGYSGDGTKHSVNVYVWDGSQWQLVGTITATAECQPRQFDATSYINTPEKLNAIKTRIESVGLAEGGPPARYIRVCWIPVYADWSANPPVEGWKEVTLNEADVSKTIHTVETGKICRVTELNITHKGTQSTKICLTDETNTKLTIKCSPQNTRGWRSQLGRRFTEGQNIQVKSSNVVGGNTIVSGSGLEAP